MADGMGSVPGLGVYRLLGGQARGGRVPRRERLPGPIWLHATDPAEYDPLRILAGQIAEFRNAPPCLVTGSTGQPGPADEPRAVEAFLAQHQPAILVLAGPMLPPNLIERAHAGGVALFLVDALAPAPPGRWRLWPGFTRALLARFEQIHTRTEAAAQALARLLRGTVPVLPSGMLARYAPAPTCNHFELDALRDTLAGRPVWFAYSLPPGECEAAMAAHAQALRRSHRLLMIVAPRDPRDGTAIATRAAEIGFACARRSADEEIAETTQIYVADAEDEPGLFLRLAQVSYLGGSLTRDTPTPSPLPAAALGSALVFGPHAEPADRSFLDQLRRAGGGRRIGAETELGDAVSALLAPEIGAEAALRAWSLATEGSDATWTLARALCDWAHLNLRSMR